MHGTKTLELMQRKALRAKRGGEFAPGWAAATALSCALAVATSLFGQGQNKAQDLKKAQREVQQGEKAEAAGHWDDALTLYDAAAKEAPGDLGIMGHAAALRAKLVRTHTDAAENAAINGDLRRATEELRTALKIDPGNTFLAEREAEMRAMNEEDTLPPGPGTIQAKGATAVGGATRGKEFQFARRHAQRIRAGGASLWNYSGVRSGSSVKKCKAAHGRCGFRNRDAHYRAADDYILPAAHAQHDFCGRGHDRKTQAVRNRS